MELTQRTHETTVIVSLKGEFTSKHLTKIIDGVIADTHVAIVALGVVRVGNEGETEWGVATSFDGVKRGFPTPLRTGIGIVAVSLA